MARTGRHWWRLISKEAWVNLSICILPRYIIRSWIILNGYIFILVFYEPKSRQGLLDSRTLLLNKSHHIGTIRRDSPLSDHKGHFIPYEVHEIKMKSFSL